MHYYTVVIIGAWLLCSGAVAYAGNGTGRRFGKRRLTVFGLRPRHTATLFTVLTGVLIAGVTGTALVLMVPNVHRALFLAEQLYRDNRHLAKEQAIAQRQAGVDKSKAAEARAERGQAEAARDRMRADLLCVGGQLKALRQDVAMKRQRLDLLHAELRHGRAATRSLLAQVRPLQTEVADARRDLLGTQRQLSDKQAALAAVRSRLQVARQYLDQANETFFANAAIFRTQPLAFAEGEEIARRVLYKVDTPDKVETDLDRLMEQADAAARKRGATSADNGRAALLATCRLGGEELDEAHQIDLLSYTVAKDLRQPVVARLVAAVNCVRGEPVQADIEILPNRLVFRRGETLMTEVLDCRASDSRDRQVKALGQVLHLLQVGVHDEALRRGLLPPPEGDVGEATWRQVLDVVRKVDRAQAPTPVSVVAAADTWTADPLLVRFEVGHPDVLKPQAPQNPTRTASRPLGMTVSP